MSKPKKLEQEIKSWRDAEKSRYIKISFWLLLVFEVVVVFFVLTSDESTLSNNINNFIHNHIRGQAVIGAMIAAIALLLLPPFLLSNYLLPSFYPQESEKRIITKMKEIKIKNKKINEQERIEKKKQKLIDDKQKVFLPPDLDQLRKIVQNKSFIELINLYKLNVRQIEPNWRMVDRLKKKAPTEILEELFALAEKDLKPGQTLGEIVAKNLQVREKHLKDYISSEMFKSSEVYALFEFEFAASMMEVEDFVNHVFYNSKEHLDDGWLSYIMIVLFPRRDSNFPKIEKLKRDMLLKEFITVYDTDDKIKGFIREFVATHPSYSFFPRQVK